MLMLATPDNVTGLFDALKYGLPGLVAIIAVLSFWLYSREQKKVRPDKNILRAILSFSIVNVILAIIVSIFTFFQSGDSKKISALQSDVEAKKQEIQTLNDKNEQLVTANIDIATKLAVSKKFLDFIKQFQGTNETDDQIINRLRDDFSRLNSMKQELDRLQPIEEKYNQLRENIQQLLIDWARVQGETTIELSDSDNLAITNVVERIGLVFKENQKLNSTIQHLNFDIENENYVGGQLSNRIDVLSTQLESNKTDLNSQHDALLAAQSTNLDDTVTIVKLNNQLIDLNNKAPNDVAIDIDSFKSGDAIVFADIEIDGTAVGTLCNLITLPKHMTVRLSRGSHTLKANFSIHVFFPPYNGTTTIGAFPIRQFSKSIPFDVPTTGSFSVTVSGATADIQ
jgi:hypothetical protein